MGEFNIPSSQLFDTHVIYQHSHNLYDFESSVLRNFKMQSYPIQVV